MAFIASALLNPVCNRVIDFAVEEYGLVRNLKEEIAKLTSTVSLIKGVLHDAEEKQANEEAVRVWLGLLKQILFDAEDILDEVATDAILQTRYSDGSETIIGMEEKVRNINSFFGFVGRVSSDYAIAHQIKNIRLKLDDMYKEKHGLGLQISWPTTESMPRRPHTSSLLADESCITGRDVEKEEIIKILLRSEEEIESNGGKINSVQVLVIVGMGGVGKTTLAKLVFNDSAAKQHFTLMVWVCVSEDFDLKRITREISEAALTSEERKELFDISNWDLYQKRFKNKIEAKRFLLVLDDLWEEDRSKWETLCEPLMCGAKGSKIIVTTRKQKTLNMVNGIPFPLKVMSSEDLWPIFKRYAFGNHESSEKMQLEIVGKQILKKLRGLPLVAKIIGLLLNESLDMKHWTNILKSEIFTLKQYSDDILPILKLSYDHLSTNLKQCFAYCSLFPKDDIFSKDELIRMWMAQNFIRSTSDFHAEQVGHESFNDLFYKSFFVQNNRQSFIMHDLIHDLAESVTKDDCFRLGDDRQQEMPENVRHVSIVTNKLDPTKLMKVWEHGNLRTLLFLHQINTFKLTPVHLDDLFMKLKRLRILGLRGCKIEKLPSSIGKLKHLRFLDLSDNFLSNLPESTSDLLNLQVLKLTGCRLLGALPRNTSSLVNLRHLEVDTEVASSVQGLGKLTALQALIVSGSKVRELADMGMLKQLRIWDLYEVVSKEEAVHARVEAKEHLEVLELNWSRDNRIQHHQHHRHVLDEEVIDVLQPVNSIRQLTVRNYQGVKSPRWMEDPSWVSTSFLERVELIDCDNWEVLPSLSQLPCLKFLVIDGMWEVTQFFSCCEEGGGGGVKTPGFPALEEIEFWNMFNWEEWEIPVEHDSRGCQQQQPQQWPLFLPRLRSLSIIGCKKLRELPPLPTTLTRLEVQHVGLTHLPGWMGCSDIDHAGGDNFDVTTPHTSSSSYPSLSYLSIEDCPNLISLGSGLLQHPLPSLKELRIRLCKELASLPDRQFRHLTSLERLYISNCGKLSWPPSATTMEDCLPSSLQEVRLYGCDNMMGELLLGSCLQKLTSLSKLQMDVSSPDTVAWLGELTSLTSLGIIGDGHVDDGALSTCLRGLSSLKSLSISNCSAITTLPSEEVLRRLTALVSLEIKNCVELRSLGSSCHALVSLKDIEIDNCPKLFHLVEEAVTSLSTSETSPSSFLTKVCLRKLVTSSSSSEQIAMWLRQLSSLQQLWIGECPQLRCFDDDDAGRGDDNNGGLEGALLDLAPSLRELSIWFCMNLSSLPSKLRSLSCLEKLDITNCPKIPCLPSAGLPETLEKLTIYGCPELEERCRKEGCPDWPLFSHVPHVEVGWVL